LYFDGYHDGSAVFLRGQQSGTKRIYKCENPKAGSPTWTQILNEGDTITGGVTITPTFGYSIGPMRCAGSTLYCMVHGSDGNNYIANYTLAGGWTFTRAFTANTLDPQVLLNLHTQNLGGSPGSYSLRNAAGVQQYTGWSQSQGFGDSAGVLWVNLIGGHYYCERGVNGTPALYYFHDITADSDVIGSAFDTRSTNEGYTPVAHPRGAWYGPQVYVVDPENGDLYVSEDGSTFNVVETWNPGGADHRGWVMDSLLDGGGNLIWARRAISSGNEVIRQSTNRGADWSDITGNLWSVAPSASSMFNMILVW
jgi:hypothetical protein